MKSVKPIDELQDSIRYRLLLIADITLDSIVIVVIILNFYCIDKVAEFLGYHNPYVMYIINFGHDPIIMFSSILAPLIIKILKKSSDLPFNFKYRIELVKEPKDSSKDKTAESDITK